MHAQLEELWIDAMEMKVGEQITTYLRKNHPEYQEIEARQKKLIEDYPMLWKVGWRWDSYFERKRTLCFKRISVQSG